MPSEAILANGGKAQACVVADIVDAKSTAVAASAKLTIDFKAKAKVWFSFNRFGLLFVRVLTRVILHVLRNATRASTML